MYFGAVPWIGNMIATMDGRVIWTNHESGDCDPLLTMAKIKDVYVVRYQIVVDLDNVTDFSEDPVNLLYFPCNDVDMKVIDENSELLWEGYNKGECSMEVAQKEITSVYVDDDGELVFEVRKGENHDD